MQGLSQWGCTGSDWPEKPHSAREVSESHSGTGMLSRGHTGSGISRVTPRVVSRQVAIPEAAPLTVSLAAQRRESAVKEMHPESARPRPLRTRP